MGEEIQLSSRPVELILCVIIIISTRGDGIPAGESRTINFELTVNDLAYWHLAEGVTLGADGAYTFAAEPGDFHLWIAPNAAEGTHVNFILR